MKSWIVNISLLMAVCCSTWLFTKKFARPTIEDDLISSLSGARKYLPPGSSFRIVNLVPGETTNQHRRFFFPDFINYALAPARVKISIGNTDTILVLLPATAAGSMKDSVIKNANIIWENTDSNYHYILIH